MGRRTTAGSMETSAAKLDAEKSARVIRSMDCILISTKGCLIQWVEEKREF